MSTTRDPVIRVKGCPQRCGSPQIAARTLSFFRLRGLGEVGQREGSVDHLMDCGHLRLKCRSTAGLPSSYTEPLSSYATYSQDASHAARRSAAWAIMD